MTLRHKIQTLSPLQIESIHFYRDKGHTKMPISGMTVSIVSVHNLCRNCVKITRNASMKRRVKCDHCRGRYGAKYTNNSGVQAKRGEVISQKIRHPVLLRRKIQPSCTPQATQPLKSVCRRQATALNTEEWTRKWRAFAYPLESLTRSSRDFVHHPLCSGVHHRSVPRRMKERGVQGPELFNRKRGCRSRTRRSELLPPGKPSIHACRAQKGSHSVTNT